MMIVFLAQGFEEIEAVTVIDILRRADLDVVTVGIGGHTIKGAHDILVTADETDSSILLTKDLEAVILPGGMPGTMNLEKSSVVSEAIDFAFENKRVIAAICAAPSILGKKGMLKGKNAVCFPGYEEYLTGASISNEAVAVDGTIITAKGAGVTTEFALAIVKKLKGEEKAEEIRMKLQCIR